MSHAHRNRRRSLFLVGLLLSLIFGITGVAHASFGEITRFGGPTELTNLGLQHVIGVDSAHNEVFVLEESKEPKENAKEEETRFLRLQEFSSTGSLIAKSAVIEYKSPPSSVNESETDSIEGIAIDPVHERLYFLLSEAQQEELPDEESPVAAQLYAYSTKPNGTTLEPAAGTAEGVLAGASVLGAQSATKGAPLLNPAGIAADPGTGEVILLGHIDEKGEPSDELENATDHFVLRRIKANGTAGEQYVDTTNFLKTSEFEAFPDSPVVTGSGASEHVDVNWEGVVQIPSEFAKATADKTPPKFLAPESHAEKHVQQSAQNEFGGALAASGEKLYGQAGIENSEGAKTESKFGILLREASTGSETGWTGGATLTRGTGKEFKCVLEPGVAEMPIQMAAGSGDDVYVLAPEYLNEPRSGSFPTKDAIIELGPGGTGCPSDSAGNIQLEVAKTIVPEGQTIPSNTKANLSSVIKQADALSVTWEFEDEATKTVTKQEVTSEQFQISELKEHQFTEPGNYKITERIKTDDLAEAELPAITRAVDVTSATEKLEVGTQPKSASVKAGQTATFTATSVGKPPAETIQWFVSTDGGKDFTESKETGAKTDTLSVKSTTRAESGNEYYVEFKNKTAEATSTTATLTVTAEAPTITEQPAARTVVEGENASFTASASGAPSPAVQWEVSTDGGAAWSPVSGATATTVTIPATTVGENGYQYRAVFTNEVQSTFSNTATLVVNAPVVTPAPTTTTETATKPPPPIVVPPKATVAAGKYVVSTAGAVPVKVSCPAGATTCSGTVTFRTVKAISVRVHGKNKKEVLTLTAGTFTLDGGASKTITLHLSSTARSLLSGAHGVLQIRATVSAHDPAGEKDTVEKVLTLDLAKHKH